LTYNSDSHLVVIPTYNEIENIRSFLDELLEFNISILIVDDNSPDGTGQVVEKLASSSSKLHLLKRSGKLGLGSAYRDGFLWGVNKKFSFMVQMDADFSHRFNDLDNILNESKTSDLVIGSRYIEGGGSEGWDFKRKLLSKTANLVSRIVLQSRINDMTSGFRCYSADTLDKIKFQNTKSDGYSFQIEMTMRCEISTLEIKEIPIIFNERRVGNSKMSKNIIVEALLFLAKNGIRRWLNLKIK
jgi:dolichol-phosphate mannosyltransferase